MSRVDPASSGSSSQSPFATTHWSLVLAAARGRSSEGRRALETLCGQYWYPSYAYLRRRGLSKEDAQDVTQAFFARLLEKDELQVADPERGRFRSFLLTSLAHFLANYVRDAAAQKRGGGRPVLSLDLEHGETRYHHEPFHQLTPERLFERRWALTVLENALGRLQTECDASGKSRQFAQLKAHLSGSEARVPYTMLAEQLGMTEGALKVAMHRMRVRCRELIREEISHTVAGPQEIDEELRDLFGAVAD